MIKQFPHEFNVGFTADMEAELDKVEEGKLGWQRVLKEFYGPFDKALSAVDYEGLIQEAHDLSALAGEKCPQCGGRLVAKGGFFGPFVAWMPEGATMTPNPDEVAEIYRVPFAEFSKPGSPEFVSIAPRKPKKMTPARRIPGPKTKKMNSN